MFERAENHTAVQTMQAIAQSEYGGPEVLGLTKVEKPVPKDNEVLVKVHASSVNAGDWHLMRGKPFLIRLMFGGLLKPAIPIIGVDVAGTVAAVGQNITQFQVGDAVFGDVSGCGFGAFAEYVCATEDSLIHKPESIPFREAGVVPAGAIAALQALRDFGNIQAGQKVLVKGASGGVGSFAVQIAKAFGAEVTAVLSTKKLEMGRSLGVDHLIDYQKTDLTTLEEQYDLILDAAGFQPFWHYLPLLKPTGTYVMVGGATTPFFQAMLFGAIAEKITGKKIKCLEAKMNTDDLKLIRDWLTDQKIKPFIDRDFQLTEVPDAIRYLEQRQGRGKIAVQVSSL
ncbi:NADPH:quinone reductase [[Leptolyngbya] sp. PCC 7376]|nr:NADPH:quinone reductase [[Leptolyngbya] sp. PCC 7376]